LKEASDPPEAWRSRIGMLRRAARPPSNPLLKLSPASATGEVSDASGVVPTGGANSTFAVRNGFARRACAGVSAPNATDTDVRSLRSVQVRNRGGAASASRISG
jgi:hypothetical protein